MFGVACAAAMASPLAARSTPQPPASTSTPSASRSPAPTAAPLDRLRAGIERTIASVRATWGVYIRSIETGEEIAIDADRQMDTMSVIKIPLMVEVFEQIKAKKLSLTDTYTLAADDIRPARAYCARSIPARS
jgi:beta-lactamase class A